MQPAFIESATSIDGAVVVDEQGTCYGIGMILDGDGKGEGDSGRGARYNSALKYIKYCKKRELKGLVVVISEDKTINVLSTEDE